MTLTPSTQQQLSEEQVRALRDMVFEAPCPDHGWAACRENWMRPENVRWLLDQAAKKRETP